MGRLPAVLHALPVSAAAAAGRYDAVPAVAARGDRRDHADPDAQPAVLPRPPRRGLFTNVFPCTPGSRAALRGQAGAGQAGGQARLQEGAVRRQRAQDAQARRAARGTCRRTFKTSSTGSATPTPTRTPVKDARRGGGEGARVEPFVWDIGINNGRYARIAAEGARTVVALDAVQGLGRAALPRPAQRGRRAHPDARDEPRRPVAGLGWRGGLERRTSPSAASRTSCSPWRSSTTRSAPTSRSRSSWTGSRRSARRWSSSSPRARTRWSSSCSRPSARACTRTTSSSYFERTLAEAFEVERSSASGRVRGAVLRASQAGMTALRSRPLGRAGAIARSAAGGRLGLPRARRAVDVRGRPTALRPAQGQPRVLRRARVVGVRRDQLVGAAQGAAAGAAARGRAAGRAGRRTGAPGRPPGPDRRARHADRRAGAEEGDQRLGPGADRAVGADRGRRRGAVRARGARALVPRACCRRRR